MGECWLAEIPPNSLDAPQNIPEAVAQFFFGDRSKSNTLGYISHWSNRQRRQLSDLVTLAATGTSPTPSFTVVDAGEGQSPESLPNTLLSLDKQNKVDIQFVQGKFNMGGTGALRFCGNNNLQLIISRRNPAILMNGADDIESNLWGFTVVRRENPTASKRVSTYTYLAPDSDRGVLRFDADSLALFPQGNRAYARSATWGTAIKLYEYKLQGRSHILRRDGLLDRLGILLPGIALPVRLHECRDYRGHDGSFDTTLTGLSVRLNDDRSENIEPGFPTSSAFSIRGQHMTAEVYAFKRSKAATYRKDEGIIFTVNGQTHGHLPKRFFGRTSVGMNSLEDSILVMVDCSLIDGRTREDLFMNSRDRMEQGEFLKLIEKELETMLKEHQLLRGLREQRRHEDVEKRLEDSRPFKDVLESIIRKYPSLARVLGQLGPLSDPFRPGDLKRDSAFQGQAHPSFFRFRGLDYGQELQRTTAINMRSRIVFETDVVNDYFTRAQYAGKGTLRSRNDNVLDGWVPDHNLNLQNGVATLNLVLPDTSIIGDILEFEWVVEDQTLAEPFINPFIIRVGPEQKPSGGGRGQRRRSNGKGPDEGDAPKGLALPTPIPVYESEWEAHGFNKESALRAVYYPSNDEGTSGSHTYYINMDNIHLLTELKATREDPGIIKSRWQFGMVLIGMALLRGSVGSVMPNGTEDATNSDDAPRPEDDVLRMTAAIAPVLLPLIEHLGALSEDLIGQSS